MSAMSDYLEQALLNHIFKGAGNSYPQPASNLYVALGTAAFTDANAAVEVTTGAWPAYARQAVAIPAGWGTPSGGQISNAAAATFAANNGAGAVVVTDVGIFDASTNGNLLFHATLPQSKSISPGDVLSFAIGALTIALQ